MLLIFLCSPKTSFIHRLPGALNLALMDRRSRSGSAHREYEREWGNPGTRRGIRGGKAARRKREAYIRHQEAQGVEQIPVARPGGQQRPLGTSRHWSPSGSEAGDDQEDLGYQEPSLVDPVPLVLAPQSRLYRPRGAPEVPEPRAFPKRHTSSTRSFRPPSTAAASSSSRAEASSSSRAEVSVPSQSRRVEVLPSSSRAVPKPSVSRRVEAPEPELRILRGHQPDLLHLAAPPPGYPVREQGVDFHSEALVDFADLHESVVCYGWKADQQSLGKISGGCPTIPGAAVVFDWHQVLDVHRQGRWLYSGVQRDGTVAQAHLENLILLKQFIQEHGTKVKIIICSHIHDSYKNERLLVETVEKSRLPVHLIVITRERAGPAGKLSAVKAIFPSRRACICDDNPIVLEEWFNSRYPCFQVRKPRQPQVNFLRSDCIGWSASSEPLVSGLKTFSQTVSRQLA